MNNVYIYILVMACTSWTIRGLPMLVLKKPIQSRFVRSFLYYVPYVTLSVMTFPAILGVTDNPLAGLASLLAGMIMAWRGVQLTGVAVTCCAVVLIAQLI